MSGHCNEELVRRSPNIELLHHSDRGCQYTSQTYRQKLEQAGIAVCRARKFWDNAAMESFCGSLKEDCVGNTFTNTMHGNGVKEMIDVLRLQR